MPNKCREHSHCVKSVQIRTFFLSAFSFIWTAYRKIRTRKNSVFGHFSRSVDKTEKSRSVSWMNFYFGIFVAVFFLNRCYFIRHESSWKYVMRYADFLSRRKQDECWRWKTYRIEAANGGVLWKKVFLKISQNSQKNTCARVSFLIKLKASGLQLY